MLKTFLDKYLKRACLASALEPIRFPGTQSVKSDRKKGLLAD